MKRKGILWVLLSIGFFLFLYRRLLFEGVLAFGDFPTTPMAASQAFTAFFSVWQPMNRGFIAAQTVPTFLQGILLLLTGNHAALAEKIYVFAIFPLAFFSMYTFLGRFLKTVPGKLFGAAVYAFSPATLGTFIGGATLMLYFHALLPFFIGTFLNLELRPFRWSRLLFFGLLFSFLFMSAFSYAVFLLGFIILYLVTRYLLIEWDLQRAFRLLAITSATFLIAVLLNLPYAMYFFKFVSGNQSYGQLAVSNLRSEVKENYREVSQNYGLGGTYRVLTYGESVMPLGILLPLLSLLSLLFWKQYPRISKVFVASIFLFALILWGFLLATSLGWTGALFERFSILLTFRSPAKLVLLLTLPYAALSAVVVEGLLITYLRESVKETVGSSIYEVFSLFLIIALFFLYGVYNWPFLTGDLTLFRAKEHLPSPKVGQVFFDAKKALDEAKTQPFSKTLWLPYTYEGTELKVRWIDEQSFGTPLGTGQYLSLPFGKDVEAIMLGICKKDSDIATLLGNAHIEYVVVIETQETEGCKSDGPYLRGRRDVLDEFLGQDPAFKKLVSKDQFSLWQNTAMIPAIVAYDLEWLKVDPTLSKEDPRKFQKEATLTLRKRAIGTYEIEGKTDEPVIVGFGELFHHAWELSGANVSSHQQLLGWQNGFVLTEPISGKLTLSFAEQRSKNIASVIWAISWIGVLGGVIGLRRRDV